MTDLSNKKALIYDWGGFGHVASNLASEFGRVWYHVPWATAHPSATLAMIGRDLERYGVERVQDFDKYIDKADLIVFPDCYCYDRVEFLRKHGYRVWGAGAAEELEIERVKAKAMIAEAGLPATNYEVITGIEKLRKFLADKPGWFVKGSRFRGDSETFEAKDPHPESANAQLDKLLSKVGPVRAKEIEFLAEAPIEGVEFGYDDSTVDGEFSEITAWGYENKDLGYIGQVCDYDDLPQPLRTVNEKLAPMFHNYGTRSFFHSEVRWGDERKPYLIDPCLRAGSPPSQVLFKILGNWPQRIYAGADGENVPHSKIWKYGVQIQMQSPWAEDDFLPIEVEAAAEPWVVLKDATMIDNKLYIVPDGIGIIGAACGAGDTLEEAIDLAHANAEMVHGIEIQFDKMALDEALDTIKKGRKYGIRW